MSDGIALLDAEGLQPAAALQRSNPGCQAWLFDPTLLDKAREAGIDAPQLHLADRATPYAELAAWAHAQASALEQRLDRVFGELYPGVSLLGWQHLNLFYLLQALRWHRELWDEQQPLFDGHRVHVLVNDNPAHYYWPSFVPGLLLAQQLRARGGELKAYTYGRRTDPSTLAPALLGRSAAVALLTHLPTCFHDQAWFNAELAGVAGPVVNLQSRHWNVAIQAAGQIGIGPADALAANLEPPALARCDAMVQQAGAVLDGWLQAFIASPDYRRRQADFMAALLRTQLLTFEALQTYFADHAPRRMLLTEHDAGFHGPLLSFAAQRGIAVTLLPHSKTIGDLEFTHDRITTLTHPLQASAVVDARSRAVPHAKLAYPEVFSGGSQAVGGIGRVGLLLNGLSLGGVQSTPYAPYVAGVQALAQWCRAQGLPLAVRSRPGQVMTDMLMQATGLSADEVAAPMALPLEAFVRSVDLCLMYDAPTNAGIDFLKNAVPLLNPVPDRLSRAEALTCNPEIVPREDVPTTLERLARWHADPVQLQAFRQQQFARYVAAFADARPLRSML